MRKMYSFISGRQNVYISIIWPKRLNSVTFFDEDLLVRARSFLTSRLQGDAEQGERPLLIAYHGDGDGCCAAYFLQRYIQRPAGYYWVATPDFDFVKLEDHICREKPHLTIFLDMPVCDRPDMIEKLSPQGDVFIYDHHYPGTLDLTRDKENVLYINPVVNGNEEAFPAALFGWELLEEKAAFDREVLFMGLFTETWLDRAPIFDDLNLNLREQLKEVARRIHSSFLVSDMSRTHYALTFLLKAAMENGLDVASLRTMTEYHILQNIYDLIQNEKKWLEMRLHSEIRRIPNPNFILKRIESRMRLCGLLASELRWKYADLVIGIWQRWKQKFYCELRRGRNCSVNLAYLIENIKGDVKLTTGGGHPASAGFTAERDSFFEALDKIRHYITSTS